MNNLIKKIIRESLDNDWAWTQFDPIEPRKKGDIMVGDIYTVYGNNYSVRYVLEILEVFDDEVLYKILVTADEVDEPVGGIQSTELNHTIRLITQDNHWVLTDYRGKGLVDIKESEKDDFDWIKEIEPDVESLAHKALSKSNNFIVETEYYGNNLYNIEFYASDGSGRYFGVNSSDTENSFITYEDIVEQARKDLEACYVNNVSEEIIEEYRELYNLLKNS
jgi:hypothetical protein